MSVKRMTSWLGAQNAMRQRQTLMLNVHGNAICIGRSSRCRDEPLVLDRFSDNAPGLSHPAFVDVRVALQNHLDHLVCASR
ncbi:MAG: hypothetical protein R3C03_01820 [Pirellulaceae bacterium]